jgi:hypothetical protein
MATPVNNDQPSLGLHELVQVTGFFSRRATAAMPPTPEAYRLPA